MRHPIVTLRYRIGQRTIRQRLRARGHPDPWPDPDREERRARRERQREVLFVMALIAGAIVFVTVTGGPS